MQVLFEGMPVFTRSQHALISLPEDSTEYLDGHWFSLGVTDSCASVRNLKKKFKLELCINTYGKGESLKLWSRLGTGENYRHRKVI